MNCDVVIPTWQARAMVAACLERLAAEPSPHTTIVVDNASDDGTVEFVRQEFPDVVLVQMPKNVGFGRAVNAGVRAGSSEAIVLLNNDVLIEPGFLVALTGALADETVGMVAALTLLPGSGRVDGFGIELDATLAAYNRLRHRLPGDLAGKLAMPSGGAAAYRRTAWESADGFDEALFAYGEDVDLGLRLRAAGWRAAEAQGARGVHLGGASFRTDSPVQRRLAGYARGFLLRRYGVLRSPAAPRALLLEAMIVGWGLIRFRSLEPLRGRLAGWLAAGRRREPVDRQVIEPSITAREAFRRLVAAR